MESKKDTRVLECFLERMPSAGNKQCHEHRTLCWIIENTKKYLMEQKKLDFFSLLLSIGKFSDEKYQYSESDAWPNHQSGTGALRHMYVSLWLEIIQEAQISEI